MFTELLTLSDIARKTGKSRFQIDYCVQRLSLTPAQRAGLVRLYDSAQVELILRELERIRPYTTFSEIIA